MRVGGRVIPSAASVDRSATDGGEGDSANVNSTRSVCLLAAKEASTIEEEEEEEAGGSTAAVPR